MSWVKIKNRPGAPHEQYGHAKCLENFNETIQCGIYRGDCGDPACCFSERYDVAVSVAAREARIAAADAADAAKVSR